MRKFFQNALFVPIFLSIAVVAYAGDLPGKHTVECENKGLTATSFGESEGFDHAPGIFDGDWGRKLGNTFVLLETSDDQATGMYALGVYKPWNASKAGCGPVTGKIKGNKITLKRFGNGAQVTYTFVDENTIEGAYRNPRGEITRGTLKRVYTPTAD